MSFISALAKLAKLNKYFSFVELAFDAATLGIDIAGCIDPNSVCVGITPDLQKHCDELAARGPAHDELIMRLNHVSSDLDNLHQTHLILGTLVTFELQTWENISQVIREYLKHIIELQASFPASLKWYQEKTGRVLLTDSQREQIDKLIKAPIINPGDVPVDAALFVVGLAATAGMISLNKFRSRRLSKFGRDRGYAVVGNDKGDWSRNPRSWRYKFKNGGKIAGGLLFNAGSCAMSIYRIANMAENCKVKDTAIVATLKGFEDDAAIEAMISGCDEDEAKLSAVKDYLTRITNETWEDQDTLDALNQGLVAQSKSYDADIAEFTEALDELYNEIVKAYDEFVDVNFSDFEIKELLNLKTKYTEFTDAKEQVDNTDASSVERLDEARKIARITGESISQLANRVEGEILGKKDNLVALRTADMIKDQDPVRILDLLDIVAPNRTILTTLKEINEFLGQIYEAA